MSDSKFRFASYCSSPAWGGMEMNIIRLLTWMNQRGWPVRFYGNPESQLFLRAGEHDLPRGAIVSRLSAGDLVNAWRLSRRLRDDKVRALIVHRSQDLFLGAVATRMTGGGCRLIFSQHMHIGGDKKDFYHAWLYRQIDSFVTPVQWLADRVMEKTSVPLERIRVLPRGVEIGPFTTGRPDQRTARLKLELPVDEPIIGLVGRLDPKKGQHIVVEALARLHREGHHPHLLLVGEKTFSEGDAYSRKVHALVDSLGMADYVHLRPFMSDVATAYAALDIFVLASKSECYGMVTIEALLSGLPVVGTNDGGTTSLIEHGRNGLLVEPLNVDDLTAALRRLFENPGYAQQLGSTAGAEAALLYSHTRQCEEWEKHLRQLI